MEQIIGVESNVNVNVLFPQTNRRNFIFIQNFAILNLFTRLDLLDTRVFDQNSR